MLSFSPKKNNSTFSKNKKFVGGIKGSFGGNIRE
jgi:hypothetical protein